MRCRIFIIIIENILLTVLDESKSIILALLKGKTMAAHGLQFM